jgi:hypothetical protein
MAALTVDVGRLYVEREELQSGADAAAMAIMEECARADIAGQECSVDDALAEFLANANAKDGAANVMEICGNIPNSTTLPACTPPVGNLTDCIPGEYAGTRPYLEVRTGTRSPENEYLLPPTLAQTLLGNGDYVGTEVRACARASYGAPAQGFAVTFSECEYDAATNGGTDFPDAPPYPPNDEPDPSYEVVLKTHDSQTNPPACGAGPAGGDGPGGFGWLTEEIDPTSPLPVRSGRATTPPASAWTPR